ncbi:MAG: lipoate--protein ligase family protein [Verrucomicrobia bacterium]|nr:lipoate--protein ligase family protein [Verrucomicrobiota bacterium]
MSAQDAMHEDGEWITKLPAFDRPRVRFYEWERKSITYGHFIDPDKWLAQKKVKLLGFDTARRPTGGGLIFHYADFSYTVAVPIHHPKCSQTVLDNYHLVNSALLEAISSISGAFSLQAASDARGTFTELCMATATQYDLIYAGRKLGGSAQRKTTGGFVHQGTLFLAPPNWEEMEEVLRMPKEAIEAMKGCSGALCNNDISKQELFELRHKLKQAFRAALNTKLY